MSPLQGLIPGVAMLALLAIGIVLTMIETVLYLGYARWYYRFGPPLHREEWQTSVSADRLTQALREGAERSRLAVSFRRDCICARRLWWVLSAWPRFTLSAVAHGDAAVVVYEARPFVSMGAMLVFLVIGFLSGFVIVTSLIGIVVIILIYALLWRHELRAVNRFLPILTELRNCGVQVCETCGYDLYMRPADAACPECGAVPKNAVPLSNGPGGRPS